MKECRSEGKQAGRSPVIDLSGRVRLFASLEQRSHLLAFFAEVFEMHPVDEDDPVLVWRFHNGAAISFEFVDDALGPALARRGAWLEVVTDDPSRVEQRLRTAGRPLFHLGQPTETHFELPGGQVVRLSDWNDL
jgi:hypothetical protein